MTGWARRAASLLLLSARTSPTSAPALVLELVGVATQLGIFYFLSALVDGDRLGKHGSGYFAFVVPGIALTGVLVDTVRGVLDDFRQGQLTGTLELLFLAPVSSFELVFWKSVWHELHGFIRAGMVVLLAALMGFVPAEARWPSVLATVAVACFAFFPFAFLAAAWVLVTRRSQPVLMVVGGATVFLAGVYFPIEMLPSALTWIARALPMVHVVSAFRSALGGEAGGTLLGPLGIATVWALVALPLSAYAYQRAVRRALGQGTLGHY